MGNNSEIIQIDEPRKTVEVHLPDGRILSGIRGLPVSEFLKVLPEWRQIPIIGAIINNELRELTYTVEMDSNVKPITIGDPDGALIYRRSVIFLLEAAFEQLFPKIELRVDHAVATGGYFCQIVGRLPLNKDEVELLESKMRALVESDLPLVRMRAPIEEAKAYFMSKGHHEKVRLLKYRSKSYLILYQLGNHRDYHHGYMVPSTGYLKWFALAQIAEGFILQYPRRHTPTKIAPITPSKKLLATFRQYGDWLATMGIEDVGALNDAINAKRIREVILVSEALHEQKISDIAAQIAERSEQVRIILIAGPSSSGKTTFSKRLAIQLLARGISPYALELDHYFVDRKFTPLDENGDYDFESLGALNTRRLTDDLRKLIQREEVQLPYYNFKSGKSEPGEVAKLREDQLIILEGIHGLNPQLIPEISPDRTYRIHVSCLTQLNLDRYNRVSTTDSRLLRRIVRDARSRGYNAQQTIHRWESVRRGEKRNIFPYQEQADEMFNSALVYELSALKNLAEPLLRQVSFGTHQYIEAKRLLTFLDWFLPLNTDFIPDNSIIREFIGGSILDDFKLWV